MKTLVQIQPRFVDIAEQIEAAMWAGDQELVRTLDDFCEHHKKMLEDIGCPLDELHVYDLLCWDCKREQKR